ncbi:hypothetical protein GCM10022419_022160 [Nonomuraea rosea]|uniref:REase associating with pPIWI RE domain-containing protein n=1 Tax=Nonomuraea rosea TaxID=638574 RepID=A0ABP6VVC9_9ACTN
MTTTPTALARPVTAAIRAGYAWSVRREKQQAWLEIARMTGVIMRHFGPGQGPVAPAELVNLLHQPLGTWLPTDDPALAGLVILGDDGQLTDDTYGIGCDYTVDLLAGQEDPGRTWLPRWRTHRAEQVEQEAFKRLVSGSDEDYTTGRRFLVENPAGAQDAILDRQTALGLPPLVEFSPIPQDRQWQGRWWPCPTCKWPMAVSTSGHVSCRFRPHQATYTLLNGAGRSPRLQPDDGAPSAGRARLVDGAVCVAESIWRYVVVPGVVEIRLHDRINALPGITAHLYPGKDRFDIGVRKASEQEWLFTLDVKDFASPVALAAKINERPISAGHLVIPDYRRDQLLELGRLLPAVKVVTETQIYRRISRMAKEEQ